MSGFTKKTKIEFLNNLFKEKTYYAGLFTSFETDSLGNEIVTELKKDSYERAAIKFSETSTLETSNSATVQFPEAREDWGKIVGIGIYTTKTDGDMINYVLFDEKDDIQIHSLMQYEIPKNFYLLGFGR